MGQMKFEIGLEQVQETAQNQKNSQISMTEDSNDSEEPVLSELDEEVGDMTTYRSLAEYRALSLGDNDLALKIR